MLALVQQLTVSTAPITTIYDWIKVSGCPDDCLRTSDPVCVTLSDGSTREFGNACKLTIAVCGESLGKFFRTSNSFRYL